MEDENPTSGTCKFKQERGESYEKGRGICFKETQLKIKRVI
jgi:hypothetical protein